MSWNGSDSGGNKKVEASVPLARKAAPSFKKGIIAGLIVVVGAGLAAWWIGRDARPARPKEKKAAGLIAEVKPQIVTQAVEAVKTPATKADKIKKIKADLNETVKGFVKKADTGNVVMMTPVPLDPKDPDNALRTRTMTEVQMLIGIEPGEPMPPIPFGFMMEDTIAEEAARSGELGVTIDNGNKRFQEELEKWKITAKETDSEVRLQRKQDLMDAQLDLLDGIDQGISVNDSIRAAWEYRKRAFEERHSLIGNMREMYEADPDPETTKQLIDNVNAKLAEKGIKPISTDEVMPDYDDGEPVESTNP